MLVIKSPVREPAVVLEVAWHGASWREAPEPSPRLDEVTRTTPTQGHRVETPEGLCVNWEPPDVLRRCLRAGCWSNGFYRVYLATGNPVAGLFCWACSRRVLTRERRRFLSRRATRQAREAGAPPRAYRRRPSVQDALALTLWGQ